MKHSSQSQAWTLGAALIGTMAGLATRRLMAEAWEATQDNPPPANPAAEDVTWGDALTWAAVSGLAVAVARVFAKRSVSNAWKRRHREPTVEWTRSELL
ncbi:hypothetical protein Poly30_03390 [Planctomycetes bacterium Poly30]|uniref:DUF4235 domain-containing protein n=1 Tax=Saltatorellus ferox TaxID=2528018 RepID=A0A518EL70_9BACT|nr:hypothetical protein Poly30_03390 [Planctomycetes bacterium Poly30]